MDDPQHNHLAQARATRLGDVLKSAREQLGLSLFDLHQLTKISKPILMQMENHQFESLPSAFVRGYLRALATIYSLDPQELIQQYEALNIPEKEKVKLHSPLFSIPHTSKFILSWKVSVSVTLMVVIAFGLGGWWAKGNPLDTVIAKFQSKPSPLPEDSGSTEYAPKGSTGLLSAHYPEFSTLMLRFSKPPNPQDSVKETQPIHAPQSECVSSPTPQPVIALVHPSKVQMKPPSQTPTQLLEPKKKPPLVSPSPESITPKATLEMVFLESSWVKVIDGGHRQLVSGLMTRGKQVSLRGEPPIRLVLGNAPGVSLKFEGQSIDTSRFGKDSMAKFTLG